SGLLRVGPPSGVLSGSQVPRVPARTTRVKFVLPSGNDAGRSRVDRYGCQTLRGGPRCAAVATRRSATCPPGRAVTPRSTAGAAWRPALPRTATAPQAGAGAAQAV